MEVKTEEKRPWLVYAIAHCSDCLWENEDYHTARRSAYVHARQTGHEVVVETGYVQYYNPK